MTPEYLTPQTVIGITSQRSITMNIFGIEFGKKEAIVAGASAAAGIIAGGIGGWLVGGSRAEKRLAAQQKAAAAEEAAQVLDNPIGKAAA
jgi:hypothetical protein